MAPDSSEASPQSGNQARISGFKEPLEVLAKAGAAVVVLFYVLGFIVLSSADNKHGILNFALFRARVICAGALAACYIGLAFWMWESAFGLGGFRKLSKGMKWREEKAIGESTPPYPYRCLSFVIAARCVSASIYLFLLHEIGGQFLGRRALVVVVSAMIAATVQIILRKHRGWASLVCWITVLAFVVLEIYFQLKAGTDFIFDGFLVFAVIAETSDTALENASALRDINWVTVITNLIVMPVFFGLYLYERIPPTFGGGKPVPVVMQFVGTSPIDGSAKNSVWMLDEGDSGFYVLQAPEDKKGVFLPRSSVAAIYFDGTTDAPLPKH